MKILSIDTSSKLCAVAILEDTNLIKEISLDNGLTHSETLMPTIKEIFQETSLSLNDIDLLVCDSGPGSFTGIRIGISTTMAFRDSLNIQSVGVTSLEALAYNVKKDGLICSLIDCKHSNCYCGIFRRQNGNYTLQEDLFTNEIENIFAFLQKYNELITFVGDGAMKYNERISDEIAQFRFIKNNDLSAYNLGLAGLNSVLQKRSQDCSPVYLKKSQAEMVWEKINNK